LLSKKPIERSRPGLLRRLAEIRVSWLDLKLGVRMFVKHRALSLVTVFGMSVAIAIGAGYFGVFGRMLDTQLPFDAEGRVVAINTRVVGGPNAGNIYPPSVHDFEQWRGSLKSIVDIGAFRDDSRNLITADGQTSLVREVAFISASAFPFTGTSPSLGRSLLAEDERPDAPPVLVIAFEEWQRRFGGDPKIIGTTVRLDEVTHTIVGVMPQGFGFPIRHRYWVPLRLTGADRGATAGSYVDVFGRLAPGVSIEEARVELAAVSQRMAAALPNSHKDLRADAQFYTLNFTGIRAPEEILMLRSVQFGVGLLLLIVAVNVSVLVYARTATRTGELAVRSALGASRGHVVAQLFVEALAPSLAAVAIGLAMVGVTFRWVRDTLGNHLDAADQMPYWITLGSMARIPESFGVSPAILAYATFLGLLAAAIVGVIPALQATGKRMQSSLQQVSARGSSIKLGGVWTALIVLQVAFAVAALPAALYNAAGALRVGMRQPAPQASQLLRASLSMSHDEAALRADPAARAAEGALFATRMETWLQRVSAEPGVADVTYAMRFAGEESWSTIEYEPEATGNASPQTPLQPIAMKASEGVVAANLFEVMGVPMLAGRAFTATDAQPGANAVIVDQLFAERLAGGGNVLGRRIRFSQRSDDGTDGQGPWREIVGVVPAFAGTFTPSTFGTPTPRFYRAMKPGDSEAAVVIVKTSGGDPTRLSQRLRELAASVHPTLKLQRPEGAVRMFEEYTISFRMVSLVIFAVTVSVLLLSAAGIYAMMSFTVAKRRREIGIRAALGADSRQLLMGVFGRASAQIGGGIALGLMFAAGIENVVSGGATGGRGHIFLPAVAGLMLMVGLLAALGPARRGLAVQPTEALRDE
jgi:putative ABC transport system permease protein